MNFNRSLTRVFVISSFHKLLSVVPYFAEPSGHTLADRRERQVQPMINSILT